MKHLTLFNNNSEFSAVTLATPNVSYLIEENQVIYTPEPSEITVEFIDNYALHSSAAGYTYTPSANHKYQVSKGSTLRDLFSAIDYNPTETIMNAEWWWWGPYLEDSGETVVYDEDYEAKTGTLAQFLDKPLFEGSYIYNPYA